MKIVIQSVKIFRVSLNEEGQRIFNFLYARFKSVPKSMIYRILRKGEVRVNKKRIKPNYKLIIGDKIRLPPIKIVERKETTVSVYLKKVSILNNVIIHEDDHVLIINKPSGTAVHGGHGLNFGVIEGLRALRPKEKFLELVHRLDRETSGVLLIAKTRLALCSLHEQLREQKIQKDYLALVRGYWKSNIKILKLPLVKNLYKSGEWFVRVSQSGKISETHFQVEERYEFSTLIRCRPITGRTHQIRVHVQHVGHPIAFDYRYGDRQFDEKLIVKHNIPRLFLHATAVKFTHPYTGKNMLIESPLDKQLQTCLRNLRS